MPWPVPQYIYVVVFSCCLLSVSRGFSAVIRLECVKLRKTIIDRINFPSNIKGSSETNFYFYI